MTRLRIDHVSRQVVMDYRIVPKNPRQRVVVQDETGAYYKVTRILVHHTTASGATASFYGIRINRETGAHLDAAPVHFMPEKNQGRGMADEIQELIREALKSVQELPD
jgi:hypothetical protein